MVKQTGASRLAKMQVNGLPLLAKGPTTQMNHCLCSCKDETPGPCSPCQEVLPQIPQRQSCKLGAERLRVCCPRPHCHRRKAREQWKRAELLTVLLRLHPCWWERLSPKPEWLRLLPFSVLDACSSGVKEGAVPSYAHWAGSGWREAHWAYYWKGLGAKLVTFSSAATAGASKTGPLTPFQRPRLSACERGRAWGCRVGWAKTSRRFPSKIAGHLTQPLGLPWTSACCLQLTIQQNACTETSSQEAKSWALLTRAACCPAKGVVRRQDLSTCPAAGTEAQGCAGTRRWKRALAPCSAGELVA
jgi:hypothetical protein